MADEAPTYEQQIAGFVIETAEPQPEPVKETPNADETKAGAEATGAEETDDAADDGEPGDKESDASGETDIATGDADKEAGGAVAEGAKRNKVSGAERLRQINEATRLMRETERNIAAREASVAAREATLSKGDLTDKARDTTIVEGDAPPDPSKFEYGELDGRYIEAKIDYGVNSALAKKAAADEKTRQADAAAAKQREMQQKVTAFEDAGGKKYDDFNDVVVEGVRTGSVPLTPAFAELILSSDEGVDVAYHLASNPKEAREIAAKSPLEQAAYFGRVAAKFSSKPSDAPTKAVVKTTQAPPPVKPARGAGATPGFDPATTDFEQFERHFRAAK